MAELTGQTDIFEELGEPPPAPPFTVHTSVWADNGCGWCGTRGVIGGGACRNPEDTDESFFYSYCDRCSQKYGHPRVNAPNYPLTIDRTQMARPPSASQHRKE